MVGGKVIGIIVRGESALLNVSDGRDECTVRCGLRRLDDKRVIRIALKDQVWWQCGKLYWTPRGSMCRYDDNDDEIQGRASDIPLEKIGYSH